MNKFQKINEVRKRVLAINTKATTDGYQFKYTDLEKIEPTIVRACADVGLTMWFNFSADCATLSIYDSEKEGDIPLETSVSVNAGMVHINDKNPIMNLGGMMTYVRRYLYFSTFCISEHDPIEEAVPETKKADVSKMNPADFEYSPEENTYRNQIFDELKTYDPQAIEKLMAVKKVSDSKNLPTEYLEKVLNAKRATKGTNA